MSAPRGGSTKRATISSRCGSERASGSASAISCVERARRSAARPGSSARAPPAPGARGRPPGRRPRTRPRRRRCTRSSGRAAFSSGPAINVVTIAISTSIANSAGEMTPTSSARLSTISSVSPRVFISVPITAEARQSKPATRAAIVAPTSLPTIASAIRRSVISHSSGRSSSVDVHLQPAVRRRTSAAAASRRSPRCGA